MSAHDYKSLREHIGHRVVCTYYGDKRSPASVVVECEDCNEVLLDYDRPEPEKKSPYRFVLVQYKHRCGEYEFSGHTVLRLHRRTLLVSKAIHKYFKSFYAGIVEMQNRSKEDDYAESYLYNNGEVGVDHITWQAITEEQAQALQDMRL